MEVDSMNKTYIHFKSYGEVLNSLIIKDCQETSFNNELIKCVKNKLEELTGENIILYVSGLPENEV
jgi:hypothetical protein